MKKYELTWINSLNNQWTTLYANNKKELKQKLDYYINVKGLKLNNEDRFDNIQVSKKIGRNHYLILTAEETINEISI